MVNYIVLVFFVNINISVAKRTARGPVQENKLKWKLQMYLESIETMYHSRS